MLVIPAVLAAIGAGCGEETETGTTAAAGAATTAAAATSTGEAPAESTAEATSAPAPPAGVPAELAEVYEGAEQVAKVQPNPYADWTPPAAPWKFCLNESFTGNPWRQITLNEYKELVDGYQKAGLASGPLVVTDSNGDATLQITQFNSLVGQGCNVIITFPANPTALCPPIAKAREKGVLVMTDHGAIDCPDVINVGFNSYKEMKISADGVFSALDGKGNVVYVTGIKGTPTQVTLEKAVADAQAAYPDVKVIGQFEGKWTSSVAQTGMSQFLATHPQKVDGVIDYGGMSVAIVTAMEQAGRPYAKVNSPTAECSVVALWKEHPEVATVGTSLDPEAGMYHTFYVAARMLKGAQPVVNTLLFPLPRVTPENLDEWYKPDMTRESTCYAQAPGKRAVEDSYFDQLLEGGDPIEPIEP